MRAEVWVVMDGLSKLSAPYVRLDIYGVFATEGAALAFVRAEFGHLTADDLDTIVIERHDVQDKLC
jgi:hypothetical protein